MKVLAIGAHPDDLEILCGGTLARYAREGAEVTMCSVANGNRGSFVHSREEIAAIRAREAAASAELLGSRYVTLGVGDTELNAADETQRLAVTELIRSVDPDVVITHYNQDYMPDHNEVSNLVEAAIFFATVPLYETDSAPTAAVAPCTSWTPSEAWDSSRRSTSTSPTCTRRSSMRSGATRVRSDGCWSTTVPTPSATRGSRICTGATSAG